jgi:hypothetical protein
MKNSTVFFARDIVSAIKNNKIDPSSEIGAEKTPQAFAEFSMSIPEYGDLQIFCGDTEMLQNCGPGL